MIFKSKKVKLKQRSDGASKLTERMMQDKNTAISKGVDLTNFNAKYIEITGNGRSIRKEIHTNTINLADLEAILNEENYNG